MLLRILRHLVNKCVNTQLYMLKVIPSLQWDPYIFHADSLLGKSFQY